VNDAPSADPMRWTVSARCSTGAAYET
jgi:hypothetical protein